MAFIIAAVLGVIALAWFLRRLFPALFAAVFVLFAPVWLCLLYTSPSPRDGLLSRMPSSA